jgi:hypothetical protein
MPALLLVTWVQLALIWVLLPVTLAWTHHLLVKAILKLLLNLQLEQR